MLNFPWCPVEGQQLHGVGGPSWEVCGGGRPGPPPPPPPPPRGPRGSQRVRGPRGPAAAALLVGRLVVALHVPVQVDGPPAQEDPVHGRALVHDEAWQQRERHRGDLLNPCRCDGSVRYTHQHCLLKWISERGCWSCELCCYRFNILAINMKRPWQVSVLCYSGAPSRVSGPRGVGVLAAAGLPRVPGGGGEVRCGGPGRSGDALLRSGAAEVRMTGRGAAEETTFLVFWICTHKLKQSTSLANLTQAQKMTWARKWCCLQVLLFMPTFSIHLDFIFWTYRRTLEVLLGSRLTQVADEAPQVHQELCVGDEEAMLPGHVGHVAEQRARVVRTEQAVSDRDGAGQHRRRPLGVGGRLRRCALFLLGHHYLLLFVIIIIHLVIVFIAVDILPGAVASRSPPLLACSSSHTSLGGFSTRGLFTAPPSPPPPPGASPSPWGVGAGPDIPCCSLRARRRASLWLSWSTPAPVSFSFSPSSSPRPFSSPSSPFSRFFWFISSTLRWAASTARFSACWCLWDCRWFWKALALENLLLQAPQLRSSATALSSAAARCASTRSWKLSAVTGGMSATLRFRL
ncbi:hypothetical protein CRUP_014429 [Coryphaenoides rupestris]|nr:hypothetical protein CRUP_014429 [Coryphaenoides rupestris]